MGSLENTQGSEAATEGSYSSTLVRATSTRRPATQAYIHVVSLTGCCTHRALPFLEHRRTSVYVRKCRHQQQQSGADQSVMKTGIIVHFRINQDQSG
jgi:hypothetical protein